MRLIEGIENNDFCVISISSRLHQVWGLNINREAFDQLTNKTLLKGQRSHYAKVLDVELIKNRDGDVLGVELLVSTCGDIYRLKLPLDVHNDNIHGALIIRPSLEFREENRIDTPKSDTPKRLDLI